MRAHRFFVTLACTLVVAALGVRTPTPAAAEDAGLVIRGYGPGVAGSVMLGPTTPVCQPDVPCIRPFAGARIVILDDSGGARQGSVVARAITNHRGNFVVSVPAGEYAVRVRTRGVFPACGETPVTVVPGVFALVAVECDTGIR